GGTLGGLQAGVALPGTDGGFLHLPGGETPPPPASTGTPPTARATARGESHGPVAVSLAAPRSRPGAPSRLAQSWPQAGQSPSRRRCAYATSAPHHGVGRSSRNRPLAALQGTPGIRRGGSVRAGSRDAS